MVRIQELFEYDAMVRRRFLEAISRLPWEEVVKNKEASHHSIRNIILHSLEVEDRLIHYIIPERLNEWTKYDFEKFGDMKSILSQVEKVEAKTNASLGRLKVEVLVRVVEFPRRDGTLYMTVEDVLIQCITEQLYHRGEIIALLWQMDVEPPLMQWFENLPEARRKLRKAEGERS